MQRRILDRIRQLCAQAVVTHGKKLEPILTELRGALEEEHERKDPPVERRRLEWARFRGQ